MSPYNITYTPLQTLNITPVSVATVPFQRIDLLHGGSKYTGGFDPYNKNYWASLASVALPGAIIGVVFWLAANVFMLVSCVLRCCCCNFWCCSRHPDDGKGTTIGRTKKMIAVILAVGFTLATTAGGIIILIKGKDVKTDVDGLIGILQSQVNNIIGIVQQLITSANTINSYGGVQISSTSIQSALSSMQSIQTTLTNATDKVNKYLSKTKQASIIVGAVTIGYMALLNMSLVAPSWLQWIIKMFLPWFSVVSWLLFGIFYMVYYGIHDMCQSIAQYVANEFDSPLGKAIPCSSGTIASGLSAIGQIESNVQNLIVEFNDLMALVPSSCGVPQLCNLYGSSANQYGLYQMQSCTAPGVFISDFATAYSKFVCTSTSSTACVAACTPILQSEYNKMSAVVSSLSILPNMTSIATCDFVTQTFYDVLSQSCTPFKTTLRDIWTSFILIGLGFSTLLYVYTAVSNWIQIKWGSKEFSNIGEQQTGSVATAAPIVQPAP